MSNYHQTKAKNEGGYVPFPIRTIAIGIAVILVLGSALIQWQKGYKARTDTAKGDSIVRSLQLTNFNQQP